MAIEEWRSSSAAPLCGRIGSTGTAVVVVVVVDVTFSERLELEEVMLEDKVLKSTKTKG